MNQGTKDILNAIVFIGKKVSVGLNREIDKSELVKLDYPHGTILYDFDFENGFKSLQVTGFSKIRWEDELDDQFVTKFSHAYETWDTDRERAMKKAISAYPLEACDIEDLCRSRDLCLEKAKDFSRCLEMIEQLGLMQKGGE